MLRTLHTNRPPEQPPIVVGLDDRCQHELDRGDERNDRDACLLLWDDDDYDFPSDDRRIQARTLRLDFPRFDGDNPFGWLYKVSQFFDYY